MLTNNSIREYLRLPSSENEFEINQVDSIGYNVNTLMFLNSPSNVIISTLDENNLYCLFIVSEEYGDTIISSKNDYISVPNPKYIFCELVNKFGLKSKLQKEFDYEYTLNNYLNYKNNLKNFFCDEIIVGNNCQFDEGVIIGGTDFSPVIGNSRKDICQFPQLGGVKLGNNIIVKYNSMIGKGTFGFTTVGDNTMIDYGCQIGHNCIIGNSCIIAAGTIIGGSTTIGDNVVIGIGAKIRNGIHIGSNVSIGMGSVVIKDIPDDYVVVGNPAKAIDHRCIFDERGLV